MNPYEHTLYNLQDELKALQARRHSLVAQIDNDIATLEASIKYFMTKAGDYVTEEVGKSNSSFFARLTESATSLKSLVKKVVENDLTTFTTNEQLAIFIIKNYFPQKNLEEFKPQLSNLLSKWKKGEFGVSQICSYQYTSSKKDTVWGRKDWLDNKGFPKPEYFNRQLLVA